MKSNQVRKNRSAAPSARQAKTPRKKAAQENVTITITDEETGELQAKFEIPTPLHDAMLRDALTKGISVQQWVENAVKEFMTKRQTRPVATASGSEVVSLILFNESDGENEAIELTPEEHQMLHDRAAKLKASIPQMLAEAILHMIETKKLRAVLGRCIVTNATMDRRATEVAS
jgi:predicted HicB family RNase H-like nuclease